ncbi:MAG: hypothetical protein HYS23_00255 [Geobacter sp.]|nr:hypothetical protein [Geobacter sp.]
MKNYMPALIASLITGLLLFIYFNNNPTQTTAVQTTVPIPSSQPPSPAYSLSLGEEPLGPGVYESGSLSKITVNNGTNTDVLIKLVEMENGQNKLVRNFYIPCGSTYKAEQLPEGVFKVIYAYGVDWNSGKKCFNRNRSFSMADTPLEIRWTEKEIEGPNGKQIQKIYGGHTIDLKGSVNGNFPAHPINEKQFNE